MVSKRRLSALFVACLLLVLPSGVVNARDIRQGDSCVITADETIEGDLFVFCRYFTLEGRVTGNVYGAAVSANLFGTVEGAVYLAAARLDVEAVLGGSLHFGGLSIDVHEATRFTPDRADVIALSVNTAVRGAGVPGSIVNVGYQLLVDAPVRDSISFWGSTLGIDAPVGGHVDATVGNPESSGANELAALMSPLNITLNAPGLRVGPEGVVGGTLTYEGPVAGVIEAEQPNPPVFIATLDPATVLPTTPDSFAESVLRYLVQVGREWAVLAIIAAIGLLLAPRALQYPLNGLYERPIASIGIGLIAFIISFPIFLILLVFSILIVLVFVLIAFTDFASLLAVLFGVLNFSGAGLFYFVAIFIARIVVCLAIGRWALRRLRITVSPGRAPLAAALLGALILAALASAPFIGAFVNALAAFLGLGALIVRLQARADAPALRPAGTLRVLRERPPLPPPLSDDEPTAPGSENLPIGFNWWR